MDITEFLRLAQVSGASDLHLVVDAPPMLRIHGNLLPIEGASPLSANIFYELRGEGVAFRTISEEIKPLEALGLPPVVSSLVRKEKGLILVTGPTGTGKSTTLAAMIDQINSERVGEI